MLNLLALIFSIILIQPTKSQLSVLIDDLLQDPNILNDINLIQPPPIPENISQQCAAQLKQFYQGIREMDGWALESRYRFSIILQVSTNFSNITFYKNLVY